MLQGTLNVVQCNSFTTIIVKTIIDSREAKC